MPEGHTIHSLAARIDRAFAGETVQASSPQGRFTSGAAELDGRELIGCQAYGKHLFIEFAGDLWLHVHLGLIGMFPVLPIADGEGELPVTGVVRLRLRTDTYLADLRGPMTCELGTSADVQRIIAPLGPDPLRPGAAPELGWERLRRSRKPVAELLLDQKVVAGVGNVYRCEVLLRTRVDPRAAGARKSSP